MIEGEDREEGYGKAIAAGIEIEPVISELKQQLLMRWSQNLRLAKKSTIIMRSF